MQISCLPKKSADKIGTEQRATFYSQNVAYFGQQWSMSLKRVTTSESIPQKFIFLLFQPETLFFVPDTSFVSKRFELFPVHKKHAGCRIQSKPQNRVSFFFRTGTFSYCEAGWKINTTTVAFITRFRLRTKGHTYKFPNRSSTLPDTIYFSELICYNQPLCWLFMWNRITSNPSVDLVCPRGKNACRRKTTPVPFPWKTIPLICFQLFILFQKMHIFMNKSRYSSTATPGFSVHIRVSVYLLQIFLYSSWVWMAHVIRLIKRFVFNESSPSDGEKRGQSFFSYERQRTLLIIIICVINFTSSCIACKGFAGSIFFVRCWLDKFEGRLHVAKIELLVFLCMRHSSRFCVKTCNASMLIFLSLFLK